MSEIDDAILNRLGETQRLLRELERIDPGLTETSATHAAAVIELTEIARTLDHYAARLELDPKQLAQLEQRVTLLETLKRKYGGTIEDVIVFGERAARGCGRSKAAKANWRDLAAATSRRRAPRSRAAARP